MNPMDFEREFSGLPPGIAALADQLQRLFLAIFPEAEITRDKNDIGYCFGKDYKGLVFVISPYQRYVPLGIAQGASLEDPASLMQGPARSTGM